MIKWKKKEDDAEPVDKSPWWDYRKYHQTYESSDIIDKYNYRIVTDKDITTKVNDDWQKMAFIKILRFSKS